MKAYIIQSGEKVDPFCEGVENILIRNKKLSVLQEEMLLSLHLIPTFISDSSEINDINEHIVFSNKLYFEAELLQEFLKESRKKQNETVCAVKSGVFTLRTFVNLQEVKQNNGNIEYNLFYYPSKESRRNIIQPIVFDLDDNLESILLPKHMYTSGKYSIPITERPIVQIDHWTNVWSANIASILASLARLRKISKVKLLPFLFKTFSFNRWKIAGLLNQIGKNCNIHPTAYIEGSTIGDNVVIGAGTVIRESIIGDNSFIGNGVTLEFVAVGSDCTILNGHILYSLLYPGVFTVTHMISTSFIGKDCFVGSGAVLTDFRFDRKPVIVDKRGKKINSGNLFLGCCLGNNVYLGGGCVIAPGRVVPSDLHISLDKDRIITSLEDKIKIAGFRVTT